MIQYELSQPYWRGALVRFNAYFALESKPKIRFIDSYGAWPINGARYRVYEVESASGNGSYEVHVRHWKGNVGIACQCPAGQHGKPCWHGIAAVQATGFEALRRFWS